jgi:surface protein
MALLDSDLLAINRGGVDYKITGAQLKSHDTLLETDLLMMQSSGQNRKVSVAELRSGALDLATSATNFFVVERDGELYAVENPIAAFLVPAMVCGIDTSGLADDVEAFRFRHESATAINGESPQLLFLDSTGHVLHRAFFSGMGTRIFTVQEIASYGAVNRVLIIGSFSLFYFANSKAITTVTFKGESSGWDRVITGSTSNFGYQMFMNCTKLTHVFGMTGYGAAPPTQFQSFQNLFSGCAAFNGDVSGWTTTNVTNMDSAFDECTTYNKTLSAWNTAKVKDMAFMFQNCVAFNQPLNSWDVSKVENFNSMFTGCTIFDRPLNTWDLAGVNAAVKADSGVRAYALTYMFSRTTAFDQDLTSWCVNQFPNEPIGFSTLSGLSDPNKPVWGTCP